METVALQWPTQVKASIRYFIYHFFHFIHTHDFVCSLLLILFAWFYHIYDFSIFFPTLTFSSIPIAQSVKPMSPKWSQRTIFLMWKKVFFLFFLHLFVPSTFTSAIPCVSLHCFQPFLSPFSHLYFTETFYTLTNEVYDWNLLNTRVLGMFFLSYLHLYSSALIQGRL